MSDKKIDDAIERVMDILAPRSEYDGGRTPIFEWGHETTPDEEEILELARQIVNAVLNPEAK